MLGLPAVGVLLAALAVSGVGAAGESPGRPAAATTAVTPSLLPAGKAYQVTLLTGDVVTVTGTSKGCPAVSVRPASKSGVLTRSCGPDGHVRVIPAQAAPLLGTELDPELFDVTALILDGYDDAHTKDLPLIVRPGGPASRLTADPLVAGLAGARALPSIGAVAGRRAKKAAGPDLVHSLSVRSLSGPAPKVWLDGRVRATLAPGTATDRLDHNLRQISAPQAWGAGYTGTGERVAVLDTGVDATHPDLVGQVAEKMDFTVDGGDAVDHFGHGTHVAATIAGTGAASHGARKGVAPGARLVVGKVLDDEGEGTDSQVIAGMEWAASRAPVVNMSLGGWDPSDGTDPMSLALDTLTKLTGTLFVVAAGNSGPVDGTVSSPGAAASALTVGAVDGDDALADFSSRGPLINTRAAKPELVAPGVDIVAARAAGTTIGRAIDGNYVAASGTSMATPQVAGAAADLAQRHPDWHAAQLKAALVGSVDPISGGDPYSSGAGRLDVARALAGLVSAEPVVNLGVLSYPQSGTADAKLAWTNTGTGPAAVSLDVAVTDHDGVAAPAGAVALSANRLQLAAGAGGGATLSVDRTAFAAHPGLYTAVVTARTGGGVTARTPVTFYVEPPSYDLTVATTGIPGAPEGSSGWVQVVVINLDDPAVYTNVLSGEPGDTLTARVPAGPYSVMATSMSYLGSDSRAALGGDPDIDVTGDTSMRVDLSQAKRLTASVDGVGTTASSVGLTYLQTARRGPTWTDFAFAWGDAAKDWNVFLAPNSGTSVGSFRAYAAFGLNAPGSLYDLIHRYDNGIPSDPAYRVTAAEKATLARIDQHFNRLDIPDSDTGHKRYGYSPEGAYLAENSTDQLSGDRTDYVSSGYAWADEAFWNGIVTQEGMTRYAPGSRQEKTWIRQPLHSDWYANAAGSTSECAPAAPARTSGNIHVELVTLTDQHGRFDCLGGGFELDVKPMLTLQRNGQTVGQIRNMRADFAVPRQAADYRLTYDIDVSADLPVSTRVSTAWTFRSAGPTGTGSSPLPLLSVDYALPLDTANHPIPSGTATFTIRQADGVRKQAVTDFTLSASLDHGVTWQSVPVDRAADGIYRAGLPQPTTGRTVSLRVAAHGDAGSGVEQTIIDAYRAG
jgi:subtilisin family serine protease